LMTACCAAVSLPDILPSFVDGIHRATMTTSLYVWFRCVVRRFVSFADVLSRSLMIFFA
jgi:hypothetical protein